MLYGHQNYAAIQAFEGALAVKVSFQKYTAQPASPNLYKSGWLPPPTGFLKLNVDGALFSNLQQAGVGFIMRDCSRSAIMAASIKEPHVANPVDIESLANLRGLQHCLNQGLSNLLIESESLVIQELLQPETTCSAFGNLILDIRAYGPF